MSTSKEVAMVSNEIPNDLTSQLTMAEQYVKSDLVPYDNPADCLIILQAARELRVGFTFAMANIHIIQRKVTIGVHLIEAVLLSRGIAFNIVEDYVPVTHWKTRGGTPVILSSDEMLNSMDKYQIITVQQFTAGEYDQNKLPLISANPPYIDEAVSDRRTTLTFSRRLRQEDGSYVTLEHEFTYYLHQAYQADYIGAAVTKPKDNWYKHPKSMMYSRCLTGGGRRMGSDLLQGYMETNEAADTFGADVLLDADGKVIKSIDEDEIPFDPNVTS